MAAVAGRHRNRKIASTSEKNIHTNPLSFFALYCTAYTLFRHATHTATPDCSRFTRAMITPVYGSMWLQNFFSPLQR